MTNLIDSMLTTDFKAFSAVFEKELSGPICAVNTAVFNRKVIAIAKTAQEINLRFPIIPLFIVISFGEVNQLLFI